MSGLYDLHTHTILSDGEMLPIDLIQQGWQSPGTRPSRSPIMSIRPTRNRSLRPWPLCGNRAGLFGGATALRRRDYARAAGTDRRTRTRGQKTQGRISWLSTARHQSNRSPGTNHAACTCRDVNVLAHPGLITNEEARLAATNGIALEITSRGGHNRTNGHVARIARETGLPDRR